MRARQWLLVAMWGWVGCGPELDPAEELCGLTNALTVCPGPTTLEGIDVSKYQSTINWSQVQGAGKVFAVARVSDGLNYPDAYFAGNWAGMKQAGIVRGVYQFFRAGQDPIAQADYVLAQLAAHGGLEATDLPPVLDVESLSIDNQPAATVRSKMQQWLDRIEQRTQRRPIIYTGAYMSSTLGTGFGRYPVWTAHYTTACPLVPSGWSTWQIWQYTSSGRVAGISGNVDLNKFNGSRADLDRFIASTHLDGGAFDAGSPDAGRPDAGRPDAGRPDAGTAPTDAGTTPTDAGTTPADAGTTPTDAGTTPADAGTTPADAGTTPADAGTTPADAGTTPADAGTTPADAGTTPELDAGHSMGTGHLPACR